MVGAGIAFFQLRERKRLRHFTGYIRDLYMGRRIKYNHTNRNVLEKFLSNVLSSAGVTRKDVYQPVVKSARRGNARNIKPKH